MLVAHWAFGGQRTARRSQYSPLTTSVLWVKGGVLAPVKPPPDLISYSIIT